MTDVVSILERLGSLGVRVIVDGPDLVLQPADLVPPDVVPVLRAHKPEIIRFLRGNAACVAHDRRRLWRALKKKLDELEHRKADLASAYYRDDPWVKDHADILGRQTASIRAHLDGGAPLDLPPCCHTSSLICLVSIHGFKSCIFRPDECGFCYCGEKGTHG